MVFRVFGEDNDSKSSALQGGIGSSGEVVEVGDLRAFLFRLGHDVQHFLVRVVFCLVECSGGGWNEEESCKKKDGNGDGESRRFRHFILAFWSVLFFTVLEL